MKRFQILVDSASDLKSDYLQDEEIGFSVVPLTINVGEEEYIDNDNLDIDKMLKSMHESKKSSSACPAPQSFLQKFEKALQNFLAVTILP